jgi:hypothetical protein
MLPRFPSPIMSAQDQLSGFVNRDVLRIALGINFHAFFILRDMEVETVFGIRRHDLELISRGVAAKNSVRLAAL